MIPDSGLALLAVLMALGLALVTGYLLWKRTISLRVFLVLETILALACLVILTPGLVPSLMALLRVEVRGLFLLTCGVLGAYLFVYAIYVRQTRQRQAILRLIQEVALLRGKLENERPASAEKKSREPAP